ncbi:MAG: hypothetical protein DMF77_09230 [Acidobacteria bacterium]|nr:MAG: hypothetical protein DMF77_09230 [Acidobacteriota bacterium]
MILRSAGRFGASSVQGNGIPRESASPDAEERMYMPFVPRFRRLRAVLGAALAGVLCLAGPAALHAQTTSASVSGSVSDSQGGVLPGATVTLTSRTQGNTYTAATDKEGRFTFPIVRPDTYVLKVTLSGFKSAERTNVVVNANDRASTGDIALSVGGIEENVTVESRVSELQVESGERSFSMESETLKNIANNGRALFNFANLVPGVLTNNVAGVENGSVSAFTVNGQRPNSNNVTTAATWPPRTSTPWRSSRSSPTPTRPSTGARPAARSRWSPRAARRPSTAPATGTAGGRTGTRTAGRTSARRRRRRWAAES